MMEIDTDNSGKIYFKEFFTLYDTTFIYKRYEVGF